MMLSFARAQTFDPGSNPRQEQSGAEWPFLLSSLEVGRIVVAGGPSTGTLSALRPLAGSIADAGNDLPAALDEPCGLVVVGTRLISRIADHRTVIAALERVLDHRGAIFLEHSPATAAIVKRLAPELGIATAVQLGSDGGVVEAGRAAVSRTVWLIPGPQAPPARASRGLGALARRLPIGSRLLAGLVKAPAPAPPLTVTHVLDPDEVEDGNSRAALLRSDSARHRQLPAYIRSAAESQGEDLAGVGWTLAPLRGYRSQKVVFATTAGQIVKVTQDPRFNARLENEFRALATVGAHSLLDAARAPRALFCGRHAGLTVVGETMLAGEHFRARSSATPDCPVARAALDTLAELAVAGADRQAGSPAAAADALAALLEHHRRLHSPPSSQLRLLDNQLTRLAGADHGELPAVFMHGDPSTLNLLVGPDGRVGLVDWENAEPHGPPLWDILYFVNAFAAWSAERSGRRWTPAAIEAALLEPSPFHELLAGAIARQRAALDLAEEVIGPLFFFFWLYLALREATRRPAGTPGPYAQTLARLTAGGESPGLTALARRPT